MGILDNVIKGAAEGTVIGTARALSQWINIEEAEQDGHKTEIITVKAKKIGARSIKNYITTIKIFEDESIAVSNRKGDFKFKRNEIANIETKKTSIIGGVDIVRFVIAFALCFIPAPPVLYGLLAGAFFYYYTLIRVLKISLVNGQVVYVYYELSEDADFIIKKLKGDMT